MILRKIVEIQAQIWEGTVEIENRINRTGGNKLVVNYSRQGEEKTTIRLIGQTLIVNLTEIKAITQITEKEERVVEKMQNLAQKVTVIVVVIVSKDVLRILRFIWPVLLVAVEDATKNKK